MKNEIFEKGNRFFKTLKLKVDFVVVGGGMAGVCAAIAAARAGVKVVLVQDRPVLGGNASSEVRLWILGATSHMGNNNRWSREGGIIDEILVENMYRNKEGNPVIFDTVVLDKVQAESNITLLLNTAIYDVCKSASDMLSTVYGFCSQNQTFYEISGKLFCDASGDGILAYTAGASYRMGAEEKDEFDEKFTLDKECYGELLGHSIYFYSKDTGKTVEFIPPSYALKNVEDKIPRLKNVSISSQGCRLWWLEYGGRLDTIHDTEDIKWELWSVVYGVWDYIKNSGRFNSQTLTLEWVGLIPGKRESRRFLGHYILTQDDIIKQHHFEDAIAFGGWAIDLHPADGVYSSENGCIQYHSKGIYEIPYRCYVSKDIKNLYYAGRIISATHVAHGSTRVMATSALGGQAVGVAAAQCVKKGLYPIELMDKSEMNELQHSLNIMGQSIPQTIIHADKNLALNASITSSSQLLLENIPADGCWYLLNYAVAQMLPLEKEVGYTFYVKVKSKKPVPLVVELRCAEKVNNYTPEIILERKVIELTEGEQTICINFIKGVLETQYGFLTFLKNDNVEIQMSNERYTGIVSVFNKFNLAVNNHGKQIPPRGLGIDSFEFWCPERRPMGYNIGMKISPSLYAGSLSNVINGYTRPSVITNAWIASLEDETPWITLSWKSPQSIDEIILYFDTDFDYAMESVQMGHSENVIPFCVRKYQIKDEYGNLLFRVDENYQTINRLKLSQTLITSKLIIEMEKSFKNVPVSLYQIVVR